MESKDIKKVVERRHPRYASQLEHWNFLEKSYAGADWFPENIHRYVKEGDGEFAARLKRAYRFNHTREVVDLVNKYLFRPPVARSKDAPDYLKEFWKTPTLKSLDMTEFMTTVSSRSSTFGCPWVIVDSDIEPEEQDEEGNETTTTSIADVESKRGPYAYVVKPQDVLDMSYDDFGVLNWILIRETVRDDEDWKTASGDVKYRYRLWTRNEWFLFQKTGYNWKEEDSGNHNLGRVPAVRADHVFSSDIYVSPAMIADIAYLDRAVANYLSNLDAIIQDQSFSQLAMPAQGLLPGDEAYDALLRMGTKRLFIYDGEHGAKPEFLSPDPRQAGLITSVIMQLIGEIYHTVGMAGERTKEDNSKGIDNSSGVAKKADADRVMALLRSKATSLETIENEICELVSLWNGDDGYFEEDLVNYSETFDVRGLDEELVISQSVMLLGGPSVMIAEQMKGLVEKLFPHLGKDLIDKMKTELDEWAKERQENALIGSPAGTKSSELLSEGLRNRGEAGDKQSDTKASSD